MRVFWFAVAVAIVAGIGFRVEHIALRQFRADESFTALRVSGHTYAEVGALFDGRLHTTAEVLHFQRIDPSRPLAATVSGIATEEPHTAPLFFVIDREIATVAGNSIPALRLAALVFSIVTIAAMYWFCFELTRNHAIAGAGAALIALSPFFVNYGAQARTYSLWAAMIAVTSALLLRALRGNAWSWAWYGAAMTVGLYSDTFMILALAAHAIYIVACYRTNRKALIAFGSACAVALLAWMPWLLIGIHHHTVVARDMAWANTSMSLHRRIAAWTFNVASILFDAEWAHRFLLPLEFVAFALVLFAAYRAFRDEPGPTVWLLASIGLTMALPLLLYDLAEHAHTSIVTRYLVPLWFVLLVAIAILFGRRVATRRGVSAGWVAGFCAVLALAAISTTLGASARVWWDNHDYPAEFLAGKIDATTDPLVITEQDPNPLVLVMGHYLAPDTQLLLFKGAPPFPLHLAPNTYLLGPTPATLEAFHKHHEYALQNVPVPAGWWTTLDRVSPRSAVPAAGLNRNRK